MTTVHAYTKDQVILDAPHKDQRRGARRRALDHPHHNRCCEGSVARAPGAEGKVPRHGTPGANAGCQPGGSDGDAARTATVDDVNNAMREAAVGALEGSSL